MYDGPQRNIATGSKYHPYFISLGRLAENWGKPWPVQWTEIKETICSLGDKRTSKLFLLAIEDDLPGAVQNRCRDLKDIAFEFLQNNPCTAQEAYFITACFGQAAGRDIDPLIPLFTNEPGTRSMAGTTRKEYADAAEIIDDALQTAQPAGAVMVRESFGRTTEVKSITGIVLNEGYLSPHFATSSEKAAVFDVKSGRCLISGYLSLYEEENGEGKKYALLNNPFILVTEQAVDNIQTLLPILEQVVQQGRHILIIARDITGEALKTLVVNLARGTFTSCAVPMPTAYASPEILEDIAILTGGVYVDAACDITKLKVDDLGSAETVIVSREETFILGAKGKKDRINERLSQLQAEWNMEPSDHARKYILERLDRLASPIVEIDVGANSVDQISKETTEIVKKLYNKIAQV